MNPCPCGWAGDPSGRCNCSPDMISHYRGRVSGPLLDRIDLHVEVARLPPSQLHPASPSGESTADVRARLDASRTVPHAPPGQPNSQMAAAETRTHSPLSSSDQPL